MLIGLLAYVSPGISYSSPTGIWQPDRTHFIFSKNLPARFARLAWMAAIVVAPAAASTAKTMASAPGTFRLRFGLVDGQRPSAQICAVERRDSLVGFTGIGHFHEPET